SSWTGRRVGAESRLAASKARWTCPAVPAISPAAFTIRGLQYDVVCHIVKASRGRELPGSSMRPARFDRHDGTAPRAGSAAGAKARTARHSDAHDRGLHAAEDRARSAEDRGPDEDRRPTAARAGARRHP